MGFKRFGGPEVLEEVELPDPVPGPEDVLIRTGAIGLNFADIYRRRGEYSNEPPMPYVLGMEGAGTVVAVGENVMEFVNGDRVAFSHVPRANATLVLAPAWKVIHLPPSISFEQAAGILLQGMTAHYLTHDSYSVSSNDTVLIHAVSGGVGALLAQICKNILGAKVIGTISSPKKLGAVQDLNLDHLIIRSQADWRTSVLEFTGGKGVDVAYDALGVTLEDTLEVVKARGTAVYYGWAAGTPPRIAPNTLMSGSKALVGGDLWSHIADRPSLLTRAQTLFDWLSAEKIRLHLSKKYPLVEAAAAHRALESGETSGKILLIPEL